MSDIHVEDDRRTELLDAALEVFARYGYRKTSMDEVAHVAGMSRQGLYLHFRSKQILFRETALHVFEKSLNGAREALSDESMSMEDRIVRAFDAWTGQYVELLHATPHRAELAETSEKLVGNLASEYRARFIVELAKTLRKAGGVASYKAAGLNVRDVAGTLTATSLGLKYLNPTRPAYLEGVRNAARLACALLKS
jgi:AcrR family transcriptional regulator